MGRPRKDEFSKKTKVEAPQPVLTCAYCTSSFCLPYKISVTRARATRFCSAACRKAYVSIKASNRIEERFRSRVRVGSKEECWEWVGRRDAAGYGRLDVGGRPQLTHRLALKLSGVVVPDDMLVCHHCDNPPCCNPDHLFIGTTSDNAKDMYKKGRGGIFERRCGSAINTSKLSEEQVFYILASDRRHSELARELGLSDTAIALIRKGRNWAHIQRAGA